MLTLINILDEGIEGRPKEMLSLEMHAMQALFACGFYSTMLQPKSPRHVS